MTNLILHMTLPETWDDEPGMIVSTKLAKIAVPSLDTTIQELKSLIEETYKVPANRLGNRLIKILDAYSTINKTVLLYCRSNI